MVTKKQLLSIGYTPCREDKNMYALQGYWDYGFDIATQELYALNDGATEPDFIAKVTDFGVLKNLLEIYEGLV